MCELNLRGWSGRWRAGLMGLALVAGSAAGCAPAVPAADAGASRSSAAAGHVAIDQLAPELEGVPLTGQGPATLAEGRGNVVLVDFWATFCKPCKALLPRYQQLADAYDGELVVIAVSVDDPEDVTADRLRAFVRDLGLSFRVVWDEQQKTVARYGPPAMPTTYLVDQQGILRHAFPGGDVDDVARVQGAIDALLRPGR